MATSSVWICLSSVWVNKRAQMGPRPNSPVSSKSKLGASVYLAGCEMPSYLVKLFSGSQFQHRDCHLLLPCAQSSKQVDMTSLITLSSSWICQHIFVWLANVGSSSMVTSCQTWPYHECQYPIPLYECKSLKSALTLSNNLTCFW